MLFEINELFKFKILAKMLSDCLIIFPSDMSDTYVTRQHKAFLLYNNFIEFWYHFYQNMSLFLNCKF